MTVQASIATVIAQAAEQPEVSLKPGEETTVNKGESPKPPARLSLLMQKNEARLNDLRGRVQELREKLKRVKPEYLDKVRQEALDRVMNINDQKSRLRDRIESQRDQLRQGR
jgi:TolA-binding protein